MEQTNPGVDLDLTLGGQQVKMKNVKSFNTIITVLTLIVVCTGGVFIWQSLEAHANASKEGANAFVSALREQTTAIKEQTSAQREQTCLMRFSEKERPSQAEFCRTISR